MLQSRFQQGITLIETVISLAISSLILAGMMHMMTTALKAYGAGNEDLRGRADQIMRRIIWAMDTARQRKTAELGNDPDARTGFWLYRLSSTKKDIILEYKWDRISQLQEIYKHPDTGVTRDIVVLDKVTDFKVSKVPNTETGVVTISMTVGNGPEAVTLTATRRLGGPW